MKREMKALIFETSQNEFKKYTSIFCGNTVSENKLFIQISVQKVIKDMFQIIVKHVNKSAEAILLEDLFVGSK